MKTYKEILNEQKQSKMFTVYKMDANTGKLSNKEHLNENELDEWMMKSKFNTILVIEDNSKKYIVYDYIDNDYTKVKSGTTKHYNIKNFKDI